MQYNKKRHRFKFEKKETEKTGRTPVSRSGFYNSPAWQLLRTEYIANNPICEICNNKGIYKPAAIVDHIIPLTLVNMWSIGLDKKNLQSLCYKCHAIKTSRDRQKKYSSDNLIKGLDLMDKFNDFE